MPANGNMKPDSRIDGRNTKNVICIAWNCDCARVLISSPSVRLATIRSIEATYTSSTPPRTGTSNSHIPSASTTVVCSRPRRSEEHTSELQSLMRISYAVFCLKKKTQETQNQTTKRLEKTHNNTKPHTNHTKTTT